LDNYIADGLFWEDRGMNSNSFGCICCAISAIVGKEFQADDDYSGESY
jgi:hypothetical protein